MCQRRIERRLLNKHWAHTPGHRSAEVPLPPRMEIPDHPPLQWSENEDNDSLGGFNSPSPPVREPSLEEVPEPDPVVPEDMRFENAGIAHSECLILTSVQENRLVPGFIMFILRTMHGLDLWNYVQRIDTILTIVTPNTHVPGRCQLHASNLQH